MKKGLDKIELNPKTIQSAIATFTKEIKATEKIKRQLRRDFQQSNLTGTPDEKIKQLEEIRKKTKASIDDFYKEEIESVDKEFKEEVFGPLIKAIKGAIDLEGKSLYPTHTTEQIILAFFCHKFNTQENIWDLMNSLDESIVKRDEVKEKLRATQDGKDLTLKENELERIAALTGYDLDDIFALEMADIWKAITPYREGSALISNGNAGFYHRGAGTSQEERGTFADCGETTVRHFLNMLLYDPKIRNWNLEPIKAYVQEHAPGNKYFKNFEDFYQRQTPALVNDGTLEMRSLFNKVIADLNDESDPSIPKIRYAQTEGVGINNELRSGFINFMYVFQRLFGLKLEPLPEESEAKRQWLEASLKKLGEALNPTKLLELNISDFCETKLQSGDDISGEIIITVKDRDRSKNLFSFRVKETVNHHAAISNLAILEKAEIKDFKQDLEIKGKTKENTAEESLWLLSTDSSLKKEKITQTLYDLFNTPLVDNNSRIHFVETLENVKNLEKGFEQLKGMLENVLENISWRDNDVLEKISPLILTLSKREEFKDVIKRAVKSLKLRHFSLKNFNLNIFENLEGLDLRDTKVQEISLKNLKDLKQLDLNGDWILLSSLELDTLTSLEELNLSNTRYLQKVSLKNLETLKRVELNGFELLSLELDTLPSLEMLTLSDTLTLQDVLKQLTLCDMPNLQKVSLKNFETLKELTFNSDLTNLSSLELDTLPSLEWLDLSYINLKEVSLKNLKNLKNLTSYSLSNLLSLELDNLTSLERLDLSYKRDLQEVSLKNLATLSELDLSMCQNLRTISFEGDFSALKSVRLEEASKNNIEIRWKECTLGQEIVFSGVLPEIAAGITIGMKELDEGTYDLHAR